MKILERKQLMLRKSSFADEGFLRGEFRVSTKDSRTTQVQCLGDATTYSVKDLRVRSGIISQTLNLPDL